MTEGVKERKRKQEKETRRAREQQRKRERRAERKTDIEKERKSRTEGEEEEKREGEKETKGDKETRREREKERKTKSVWFKMKEHMYTGFEIRGVFSIKKQHNWEVPTNTQSQGETLAVQMILNI